MKVPLRERIAVFRYEKSLSADAYERVRGAVVEVCKDSFVEDVIKSPFARLPAPALNGAEPDWSTMRIGTETSSRFWNSSRTHCVQLTDKWFSFNYVVADDSETAGTFTDFCDSCHHTLQAVIPVIAPYATVRLGLNYVNRFDAAQLQDYLDPQTNGYRLALVKLLSLPSLGFSIPGATFTPPIHQVISYLHEQDAPEETPRVTTIDIAVPLLTKKDGWRVDVVFNSETAQPVTLEEDKILATFNLLHGEIQKCFTAVFTEDARQRMEVAL